MKQNSCPVVAEVAKPTGISFDELNGVIEAFGADVSDSVLAEVEQSLFMAPQHLDNLFDWLQLAAHRIVRPGLEEAFGRLGLDRMTSPQVRRRSAHQLVPEQSCDFGNGGDRLRAWLTAYGLASKGHCLSCGSAFKVQGARAL